jgi:peptide/nickel transport system permease protein
LYRFTQSRLSVIGLVLVLALLLLAWLGPTLAPYPEHLRGAVSTAARFQTPSAQHWFGTNELGQDVFSLVLGGTRISVLAGLAVVLLGALVGTLVGALAGYAGGWADEVLMRLSDLKLTVPGLVMAMAVAAALGPGIVNMVVAISLSWWPGYARLVRGEVLSRKEELFVTAARAIGAGPARLLLRHILPNVMTPVIVKMSLDMGFAILTVASLGFIGIGVKPPTPEWGSLLSVARSYMPDFWWTAVFPGLAIFVAVFGFNLLGDGLRDVFDPRSRR